MKINEDYFMKKILFMLPLLLFTSCVETSLSSSTSSFERKKYTLNVYQVYEEEHDSNIWSNPRFDTLFEFYNDEKITLSFISHNIHPIYTDFIGDGYFIVRYYFNNYETLERTENEFYINQDTAIYYGCEG